MMPSGLNRTASPMATISLNCTAHIQLGGTTHHTFGAIAKSIHVDILWLNNKSLATKIFWPEKAPGTLLTG